MSMQLHCGFVIGPMQSVEQRYLNSKCQSEPYTSTIFLTVLVTTGIDKTMQEIWSKYVLNDFSNEHFVFAH